MDIARNLTVDEAANILGITPSTLRRLASGPTPTIGSLKIGQTRVFPPAVLEEFIEKNTTPAAPQNSWGLTRGSAARMRRTA